MSGEITIILAKASWCPHCVNFTPIYELAQNTIKPNNDLDGCPIKFLSYELDNENEKQIFIQTHPGLIDFLEGYPTVYFQYLKGGNRAKTEFINHTVAKEEGNKGIKKAVQEFVENIINKYKSIKSGRVDIVKVQKGGMLNYKTSMDEVNYRNKYLKYKSKYLELKNK